MSLHQKRIILLVLAWVAEILGQAHDPESIREIKVDFDHDCTTAEELAGKQDQFALLDEKLSRCAALNIALERRSQTARG